MYGTKINLASIKREAILKYLRLFQKLKFWNSFRYFRITAEASQSQFEKGLPLFNVSSMNCRGDCDPSLLCRHN
jgi:hypothetical protein